MKWKELKILEENDDLDQAIEIFKSAIHHKPDSVSTWIEAIYVFHEILTGTNYLVDKKSKLAKLFLETFQISSVKFAENPEYLFFLGKIMWIAPWYFGQDSEKLALSFQRKAMNMEPDNELYRWAYLLSCNKDEETQLANQIVSNKSETIKWLKSKGYQGEYVLENLKASNERYLQNKVKN